MDDFERFFRKEYDGVVRSLALVLGDFRGAENAAQEAFARACRSWATVGDLDRPGTWVYVVALRAERRRLARDAAAPRAVLASVPDLGPPVVDGSWLLDGLGRLAARQRCAVVLRYYADLTVDEIAGVMGCAPGTVKATLHAALRNLRVTMRDTNEEMEEVVGGENRG